MIGTLATACAAAEGTVEQQTDTQPAAVANALPRFDILEYRVEGNEVLPVVMVERAVYPFLGPDKTIEDVKKARAALELTYQQAGYLSVFVDIPEQGVDSGVVTLQVVEGEVARLRVTGNRYFSQGRIRATVPSLAQGSVPNFNDVQREVAQLNRQADRKVTPVLRPGALPGQVEAELKVDDKSPLHWDVEINNRQTPNTHPLRLQASVRYDNVWQRGHSFGLTAQTAPEDTNSLRVFVASYTAPLSEKGDLLALYAINSNSSVAAVGTTSVIGKGTIFGVRRIAPLRSLGGYSHFVSLGLDHKDFGESVRLGSDSVDTPITYVPIVAEYRASYSSALWTQRGSLSVSGAPRDWFTNSDEEFARKRFNARASYLSLRGDWLAERKLNEKTSLRGRLLGQLASQPLISSEQLAAGGLETVRGYLEAERLADRGLIMSLEARRALAVKSERLQAVTLLAFVEGAMLGIIDALPGQPSSSSLLSTGVGLRLRAYDQVDAALDFAIPLEAGQFTRKHDPRVHFRVAARF